MRDELVATPEEPPTQVAAVAVRSDGSVVGLYGGPERIHYKTRSPEGTWGSEVVVDAEISPNLSGPQAVVGDVVHMAYTGDDGTFWYRRLQPDGVLTPRIQLATGLGTTENDAGSILPLVYVPDADTVTIIYRLTTGRLWSRRVTAGGPPSAAVHVTDRVVVQNAVDSDQTAADAIAVGRAIHVLFVGHDDGNIYLTCSDSDCAWQPSMLLVNDIDAQWIRGTWFHRGGESVIGYVFDASSGGGSGMNRSSAVSVTAPPEQSQGN